MSDESPGNPESETKVVPLAKETPPGGPNSNSQTLLFVLIAWIVPGLGHLLLHRWAKALAFFAVVAALIILGCAMRGAVFAPGSDGPLGTLGFVADIGSGAFYFLARAIELPRADLSTAAGDYGTRLIAAAGIINVLAAVDAFQAAAHRKIERSN